MKRVYAPIHYLACDAGGACATFEFDKDKVIIADATQFPALTNGAYRDAVNFLGGFEGFGGSSKIPFGSYASKDRFVILSAQLGGLNAQPTVAQAVSTSFTMLKSVRGRTSVWNLVHDLSNGVSYFRRLFEARRTRETRLADFDLSCKLPAQIVDLDDPDAVFADYKPQLNRETVELAGKALGMEKSLIDAAATYPDTTVCAEDVLF